ncbi:MAG: DUF1080 domain-containing protein [Sedimentisphaerales bacterium]|nr:DUF1080 domain-containing protein [Sedimentisphaerales bacterium]
MTRYGRATTTIIPAIAGALLIGYSISHCRAELLKAKDGSGIVGYKDTPVLPWCGYHVHDPDRPAPGQITPGKACTEDKAGTAPSDAVVLFDGGGLSQWENSDWKIENGELIAVSGNLATKGSFGDCQVHIEWRTPSPPQGSVWDQGNNGVLLMGLFEIQIYDSYTTKLYPDGQAGSIYGQTPPMVNACRAPGEWQSYDIVFVAPVSEGGKVVKPARVTVLHNGILVHHNEEIRGPTGHRIMPRYDKAIADKLPLVLSSHNNPVRFRNIWIREL